MPQFDQSSQSNSRVSLQNLALQVREVTDTVTDNFRIISLDEYKVI